MEITKREVIASITIIAFWLFLGFLISVKIDTWQQDQNAEYDRAARIKEPDLFQHGMDTNLGNAFVYGELVAQDPVTFQEIGGSYFYVLKVKERYTEHERTVTKTRTKSDGKTETYTEIETYWTWDEVDRKSKEAEKCVFLGKSFDTDKIILPSEDYLDCIKESYYVRYKYYGVPDQMTGTIYTKLESDGSVIVFWIFWIIAMIGIVYGFYCLDNNWLNR